MPRGCYDQLTDIGQHNEKRRMSKVRINDLARELEVKSKQILDALQVLGLAEGKTHSSSIESGEAERVRGHFARGSRSSGSASANSRNERDNQPKIDLSNISKPGDVLKAIQARKEAADRDARYPQRTQPLPVTVPAAGSQPGQAVASAVGPAGGPASSSGSASSGSAFPGSASPSGQSSSSAGTSASGSGGVAVVRPGAPPVRVVSVPPRPEPRKVVPQAAPGAKYRAAASFASDSLTASIGAGGGASAVGKHSSVSPCGRGGSSIAKCGRSPLGDEHRRSPVDSAGFGYSAGAGCASSLDDCGAAKGCRA